MLRFNISSWKPCTLPFLKTLCAIGACLFVISGSTTFGQQTDGVLRLRSLTERMDSNLNPACTTPIKTSPSAFKDPERVQSDVFQRESTERVPDSLPYETPADQSAIRQPEFEDVPSDETGPSETNEPQTGSYQVGPQTDGPFADPNLGEYYPDAATAGELSPFDSFAQGSEIYQAPTWSPSWSIFPQMDQPSCSNGVTTEAALQLWNWNPHALWLPYYNVPPAEVVAVPGNPVAGFQAQDLPSNHGDYPATEFSAVEPPAGPIKVEREMVATRKSLDFASGLSPARTAQPSTDYRQQELVPINREQHPSPFRNASVVRQTQRTAQRSAQIETESASAHVVVRPPMVQPYKQNQFTFVVENTGSVDAQDVRVQISVNKTARIVASLPEESVFTDEMALFPLKSIPAGSNVQIHLTAISNNKNPINFESSLTLKTVQHFGPNARTKGRLAATGFQQRADVASSSAPSRSGLGEAKQRKLDSGSLLLSNPFFAEDATRSTAQQSRTRADRSARVQPTPPARFDFENSTQLAQPKSGRLHGSSRTANQSTSRRQPR